MYTMYHIMLKIAQIILQLLRSSYINYDAHTNSRFMEKQNICLFHLNCLTLTLTLTLS